MLIYYIYVRRVNEKRVQPTLIHRDQHILYYVL